MSRRQPEAGAFDEYASGYRMNDPPVELRPLNTSLPRNTADGGGRRSGESTEPLTNFQRANSLRAHITEDGQVRRQKSLVRPERARNQQQVFVATPAGPAKMKREDSQRQQRRPPRRTSESQEARQLRVKPSAPTPPTNKKNDGCPSAWVCFSRCITCYAPKPFLECCGMRTPEIQQAWREKMSLVTIIVILCLCVGFLTFGFQQVFCGLSASSRLHTAAALKETQAIIKGSAYELSNFEHPSSSAVPGTGFGNLLDSTPGAGQKDLSLLFQSSYPSCMNVVTRSNRAYFPCAMIDEGGSMIGTGSSNLCHSSSLSRSTLGRMRHVGEVYYDWQDLDKPSRNLVTYNGVVLDMNRLNWLEDFNLIPDELQRMANVKTNKYRGQDISMSFARTPEKKKMANCIVEILKIGMLDTYTIGCITSDIVLYVSLVFIVGVVLAKFFLAVFFGWCIGWRLGAYKEETQEERRRRLAMIEEWEQTDYYGNRPGNPGHNHYHSSTPNTPRSRFMGSTSRFTQRQPGDEPGSRSNAITQNQKPLPGFPPGSGSAGRLGSGNSEASFVLGANGQSSEISSPRGGVSRVTVQGDQLEEHQPYNFPLAHTMLLVTCYSEGTEGIRATLDSLACTDYPASHKLLVVIADGIIFGAGNEKSTPDLLLDMMTDFVIPPEEVPAHSYVAIADGVKRHNMAKVYAGFYRFDDELVPPLRQQRVPFVLIVKVGGPEEQQLPKAGNRGKRDTQVILMSFLQRVMFDERMTELEYELFNAIWNASGVTPDHYEIVLMVDADTKVYPDSLTRMVCTMVNDPTVMGLCGETKIANKTDSWVTAIQVFEYYISHHQSKAFESVFGGVTCLPGCFCMYRIKTPKGPNGYWVPVLANPDIVAQYSENVVDTLHKKNLLLLGEDRFLSTLMLRTFPKRKMLFVPQAICKTIVPDSFSVLLSQRRRWINSTVHNLLELVLVRDLCGTFCCSMQFVIFMELVGTVVLPAAITFTLYLIIVSFLVTPVPVIPLLLLAAILGLPAVLILLTTRKLIYVMWMLVYLLALLVWNFALPAYAFWHFDDFSWGETRKVTGDAGGAHGEKEGEFDHSRITMKRWCEFEREKRRRTTTLLALAPSTAVYSSSTNQNDHSRSAASLHSGGGGYQHQTQLGYFTPNFMQHRNSSVSSENSQPAANLSSPPLSVDMSNTLLNPHISQPPQRDGDPEDPVMSRKPY